MLTLEELKALRQKENIEKQDLINIKDVKTNASLSVSEGAEHFFNAIGNPYHFMCDDIPVIIRFSDNSELLSEKLERYFIRNKE